LEPAKVEKLPSILTWPTEGPWQVRVVAHPSRSNHVEGEAARTAEGMYDKMGAIGAHEVVVENAVARKTDGAVQRRRDRTGPVVWPRESLI